MACVTGAESGAESPLLHGRWNCSLLRLYYERNDPDRVGGAMWGKAWNSPSFLLAHTCQSLGLPAFPQCEHAARQAPPDEGVIEYLRGVYAGRHKPRVKAHPQFERIGKRGWAASAQEWYVRHVAGVMAHYKALVKEVDGLVVSGAGGYNRRLNTALFHRYGGRSGGGGGGTRGAHRPWPPLPLGRGGGGGADVQVVLPQRGRLWTACGQRCVDSKNTQTTPATTSTSSIRQLLGAADTQTAHHATFSTAPTHQLLGSANAETTPARAPAAAANSKQRPDATCEGNNG